MRRAALVLAALAILASGCSGDEGGTTGGSGSGSASGGVSGGASASGSTGGSGTSASSGTGGGTGSTGTLDAGPGTLVAIVRDLRFYDAGDPSTDPDFENPPYDRDGNGNPTGHYLGPWDDRGIVQATLGADHKPVYAHAGGSTLTTHGQAAFDAWYHDTPGTNLTVQVPFALTALDGGTYQYDSNLSGALYDPSNPGAGRGFFPIDDGTPYATAFGDQGAAHNFSFTCEIHTRFTHRPGDAFTFRGDDDVFVFVDGRLAIDVGGIHGPEEQSVDFAALHLADGGQYDLDFFSAERHQSGSNIKFETTLDLQPIQFQ
jgi:fibro-slime domain-containing protein